MKKSHIMFMFHKTKNKNKEYFSKNCLQCFSSINVLTEQKEVCLSINRAQSVRLEKGTDKIACCTFALLQIFSRWKTNQILLDTIDLKLF